MACVLHSQSTRNLTSIRTRNSIADRAGDEIIAPLAQEAARAPIVAAAAAADRRRTAVGAATALASTVVTVH